MIPYMGGKCMLSSWIISHFPQNYEQQIYVEPFGGGGWVIARKRPSSNEVYNDARRELVNLFRQIRDEYDSFQHKVNWTFYSRDMFDEAKTGLLKETTTPLDRALFFLIIKAMSFAANESTYGYSLGLRGRNKWAGMLERVSKIRERMLSVNIECDDFQRVIERYDGPNTLFYCDPPYVDKEHYYSVDFGIKDHQRLHSTLKQIQGKFVLSYYPHDFVKSHYSTYRIVERQAVKSSYGITRNNAKKVRPKSTELLIMNY